MDFGIMDPVKAEGILAQLTRKERYAARQWQQKWTFLTKVREIQEQEAQKIGMSVDEYRDAVISMNCRPEPTIYPVQVDPSPTPLSPVSSGMIGRRARCPLERYGQLVKTSRHYPLRPPLPPGQVYDPYKQTIIFLGTDVGDPISYKLPPARCEVADEMWSRPQQLTVAPIKDHLAPRTQLAQARGHGTRQAMGSGAPLTHEYHGRSDLDQFRKSSI